MILFSLSAILLTLIFGIGVYIIIKKIHWEYKGIPIIGFSLIYFISIFYAARFFEVYFTK